MAVLPKRDSYLTHEDYSANDTEPISGENRYEL